MKNIKWAAFLFLSIWFNNISFGQSDSINSPIIFIYDGSGSMWGEMEDQTKMEIASDVLVSAVNDLSDNQPLGLVAYGHRTKGDCSDVEFLVNVENGTKEDLIASIKSIKPLGKTPLANSALQVIDYLRQTKVKATIILVTDGIESCAGNICEVIRAAREEGIDFRLHVIGFGIEETDLDQLKCAAKEGNGYYYEASDANGLSEVLDNATSAPVDLPKNNFSVYAHKNGIAIDAWIKAYDVISKRKPIAVRTYQDTALFYLPPSTYNFDVQPLEGSDVNMITVYDIKSTADTINHKTFSFDAGKLGIKTTNNGENWDCVVKVLDSSGKVVATKRTYNAEKEMELNPGTYSISIQALKLEGLATHTEISNIEIRSTEMTPVSHNFRSGRLEIFTQVGDEHIDAIVNIKEVNSRTNVGGSRTYNRGTTFLLNPGNYDVTAKPLGNHKDRKLQNFRLEVKEGELTTYHFKF